jgi:hypothetical protein
MNDVSSALNVSDADRKRLSNALTNKNANNLINNADALEETRTLLSNVFGSYGAADDDSSKKIQDRSRIAYDRVLAQYCVRPIATFMYVRKQNHLTIVNEWMPATWMEDCEVKDTLSRCSGTDDNGCDNRDNVSGISSDLFWVDINPISDLRHRHLTDAL